MSIKITVEVVEHVYDLLRQTAPFDRWNLPYAEEIGFAITRDRNNRGEFYVDVLKVPFISVNQKFHHTLDELIRTVAHEMCHLRDHLSGSRADVSHGRSFNSLADTVCKHHNFDRGAF